MTGAPDVPPARGRIYCQLAPAPSSGPPGAPLSPTAAPPLSSACTAAPSAHGSRGAARAWDPDSALAHAHSVSGSAQGPPLPLPTRCGTGEDPAPGGCRRSRGPGPRPRPATCTRRSTPAQRPANIQGSSSLSSCVAAPPPPGPAPRPVPRATRRVPGSATPRRHHHLASRPRMLLCPPRLSRHTLSTLTHSPALRALPLR